MRYSFRGALIACFLFFIGSVAIGQGRFSYVPVDFEVNLTAAPMLDSNLEKDPLYAGLTEFQQDMIYYINYVRMYPARFCKEALDPYLKAYPQLKPNYGESLRKQLLAADALPIFYPDSKLIEAAKYHSVDLAKHKLMSHSSSNGTSMQQRFQKFGIYCGSECVNMSPYSDALDVLLSLLVDYNVPDLGHRKAIMNGSMINLGVGSSNSSDYMQYTVIDFGCANQ